MVWSSACESTEAHCGQPMLSSPALLHARQCSKAPALNVASHAPCDPNHRQAAGLDRQHLSALPPSQPEATERSPPTLMYHAEADWLSQNAAVPGAAGAVRFQPVSVSTAYKIVAGFTGPNLAPVSASTCSGLSWGTSCPA